MYNKQISVIVFQKLQVIEIGPSLYWFLIIFY